MLAITKPIRTKSSLSNLVIVIFMCFIGLFSIIFFAGENTSSDYFFSVNMRLSYWEDVLKEISLLELLFPYKQFQYGAGGESFLTVMDNAYLYSLITIGIIGLIFIVHIIKKGYHLNKNNKTMSFVSIKYLTLGLLILALSLNIFQGRGFFSPYLLLLGLNYNKDYNKDKIFA